MLKKKWSDDGSCFEGDAFERGPFTIRHKQAAEGLSEVLPTVSAWELEDVLAPFCDCFVRALDILDEVVGISRSPFESRR